VAVSEAAASGDRLLALEALREALAAGIDGCESARDLAALSRQMTDVLAQIEEVKKGQPEQKGTALDELQKRRAARVSGGKGRAGTGS
jgi:hypothetical protein